MHRTMPRTPRATATGCDLHRGAGCETYTIDGEHGSAAIEVNPLTARSAA